MSANTEKSSLSLSFLDVLSCGLGGSVLLFLILSSLSHQGDRRSKSREGLPLEGIMMGTLPESGEARSSARLYRLDVNGKSMTKPSLVLEGGINDSEPPTLATVSTNDKGVIQMLLIPRQDKNSFTMAVQPADGEVVVVARLMGAPPDFREKQYEIKSSGLRYDPTRMELIAD